MIVRQSICAELLAAVLLISCTTTSDFSQSPDPEPYTLSTSEGLRQPERIAVSADGRRIAYVVGDSLWIEPVNKRDGAPVRVSAGMSQQILYERPFLALSPDGNRVAFRVVGGGVHDVGIPRWVDLEDEEPSPRDLLPDSLLNRLLTFRHFAGGSPAWSPDGSMLAFVAVDTTLTDDPRGTLQLYVARVDDGTAERITSSTRMKFDVEWSPDGRWLAVTTGDFGARASSVELFGVTPTALEAGPTAWSGDGPWATDLLWSPDGSHLLFHRFDGRPVIVSVGPNGESRMLDVQLPAARYRGWTADGRALLTTVSLGFASGVAVRAIGTGETRTLTDSTVHAVLADAVTGDDGTRIVWTAESGNVPPDVFTATLAPGGDGLTEVRRLTDVNPGIRDRLPGRASVHQWTAMDGSDLYAQVFKPAAGSGPGPLVVIPYGGYHNTFPRSAYFLDLGIWPLVANGYTVVRPNTRGRAGDHTPVGRYGEIQLEDIDLLIDDLVEEGRADAGRVAVLGHSHGASLAYYFLTNSPRFCAVVAVNGRADWELQAREGDAYLVRALGGPPDSVADVYRRLSPLTSADRASAPLLAVAGGNDTQILPANAERMVSALRSHGLIAELLSFPDQGHLLESQQSRRNLWDRIFAFLDEHC